MVTQMTGMEKHVATPGPWRCCQKRPCRACPAPLVAESSNITAEKLSPVQIQECFIGKMNVRKHYCQRSLVDTVALVACSFCWTAVTTLKLNVAIREHEINTSTHCKDSFEVQSTRNWTLTCWDMLSTFPFAFLSCFRFFALANGLQFSLSTNGLFGMSWKRGNDGSKHIKRYKKH